MQFSNSSTNAGIVEQVRAMARVDATQWPVANIVNSTNNWLDFVTGYALTLDRKFNWDDSNHTALPIGTTPVTASSDYSFLTDEQGNKILTLLRIEFIDANGDEYKLSALDEAEETKSLGEVVVSGTPTGYYKLADNIIRLNRIPTGGTLRFYFQRTPSYMVATDTTKEPGIPAHLHRGFVIAGAYDCVLALGLNNIQPLSVELVKEEEKVKRAFAGRNNDEVRRMTPKIESCR